MNRENSLSIEEWRSFVDANSLQEAKKIILLILEDPQPKLEIPSDYVVPMISEITTKLTSLNQIQQVLDQMLKLR